ncbi:MAG TPA: universal stress protein [Phycisphaerae bacterium]|nr:universal stress protein [Phycisphaerae bacterium]
MTFKPKKVLWPTDFSDLSLKAGRYAAACQRAFDCELHALHVVAPPLTPDVSVMLPAEMPLPVASPEILDGARDALQKIIDQHFGGDPSIRTDVFYGNAWNGICDYAARNAIDLIVVTTHGRTGLQRALIGSTAERIVQHAPCPVLTIREGARDFLAD